MAFLFPSSNNILFKYLFFSIKGLMLSLRKNLDIIKDIEADIVADIEHKIMPNIGPNNIPENKAKVTPGKAKNGTSYSRYNNIYNRRFDNIFVYHKFKII